MPDRTKILLVAATEIELPPVDGQFSNLSVESLVTGVGMVATTFVLTNALLKMDFDLVVNVGIAGSFKKEIVIGEVLQVTSDRLVELGAEDHDRFLSADQMKLVDLKDLEFTSNTVLPRMKSAKGITVNKVHGNEHSIAAISKQFSPDVESMEGAAVGYVCSKLKISWVQIRSISNMVEPRNREAWNIPLAVKNLHKEVLVYLQILDDEA